MRLIKNDTLWNDPFADLDLFINRAFSSPFGASRWLASPFDDQPRAFRVDSFQDNDNYYLVAELPGFDKKDVNVELENSVLTITAERKEGEGEDARMQSYSRSLTVGDDVNPDSVSAKLENGLLKVALPKAEERKPRAIAIS